VFLANLQGEVVAVKKFKPWAGQDEESLKKEIELLRHASIRNAVPAVYLGRSIITYVLSLSLFLSAQIFHSVPYLSLSRVLRVRD
jgi:hypothetical protein